MEDGRWKIRIRNTGVPSWRLRTGTVRAPIPSDREPSRFAALRSTRHPGLFRTTSAHPRAADGDRPRFASANIQRSLEKRHGCAPETGRAGASNRRGTYAVAGAAAPSPGSSFGPIGLGISGRGVAACAPEGGSTCGVGGGGVNFPVRTISATWVPSSVS
jgi:hypothetical protein